MFLCKFSRMFKVWVYFSNTTEFYVLKSVERLHFKEVELFRLTKLSCDCSRKQCFLSIYTSLSSRHAGLLSVLPDVSLESGLFLTRTVLCPVSFSPWSPSPAPHTPRSLLLILQSQQKPHLHRAAFTATPKLTPSPAPWTSLFFLIILAIAASSVPSPGLPVGVQRYLLICMESHPAILGVQTETPPAECVRSWTLAEGFGVTCGFSWWWDMCVYIHTYIQSPVQIMPLFITKS